MKVIGKGVGGQVLVVMRCDDEDRRVGSIKVRGRRRAEQRVCVGGKDSAVKTDEYGQPADKY